MNEWQSQSVLFVQCDFEDSALGIEFDFATDVKHIAYHTQYPVLTQGLAVTCEQVAGPSSEIIGELGEQDEHLLGRESAFVAFGESQSFIAAPEGGFHTATTEVVGVQGGEQDLCHCGFLSQWLAGKPEKRVNGQVEHEHPIAPFA